jgi:hypothetical protein
MPAGRGDKRFVEPLLFLSQLEDFKEASAPVKILEEREAGHTTHCDSKIILHFSGKYLLCIVST